MRTAVCQVRTVTDDVLENVHTVLRCMETEADIYVFPEMFLSGYFSEKKDAKGLADGLELLRDTASKVGACIIVGGPEYCGDRTYNCAYVITDRIERYRKIHLPNFPPFTEKERFAHGCEPMVFEFRGMKIGLTVCYDLFFPELMRTCTLMGAEMNVCISASPDTSRQAFERTVTARPVENTTYVVFCNNIGTYCGMNFYGGSRAYDPTGELLFMSEEEGVTVFDTDPAVLDEARKKRPTIKDAVAKITWD